MGNTDSCFTDNECPMCKKNTHQQKVRMNPYIWFYLDVYKELAPKTIREIGIEAGRRWRTMTKEEKEPYIQIAKQNKTVHILKPKRQSKGLRRRSTRSCRTIPLRKKRQAKGVTTQTSKFRMKKSKLSKPVITASSKGLFSLKRELDCGRRIDKQSRIFTDRKSVSYNYLPKRAILREEEKLNYYNSRRSPSKSKIFKVRKNGPQIGAKPGCNCNKDDDCLGEKKSLKVLFRAGKNSGLFDNDGFDEEEFNFSFLRGSAISSADLKRKGSFAVSETISPTGHRKHKPFALPVSTVTSYFRHFSKCFFFQ